jgi:hypothetical protein
MNFFSRSLYAESAFDRPIVYTSVGPSREWIVHKIMITLRIAYFFGLNRASGYPYWTPFLTLKFKGNTPTPVKTRFAEYIFDRSAKTATASGKIPTATPDLSRGFATHAIKTKFKICILSQKAAFERKKSSTNFQFKQTFCSAISEPSSKNMVKKFFRIG